MGQTLFQESRLNNKYKGNNWLGKKTTNIGTIETTDKNKSGFCEIGNKTEYPMPRLDL